MKKKTLFFGVWLMLFIISNIFLLKTYDTRDELYRFELSVVEKSLDAFKKDIGRYPNTQEGLSILCQNISQLTQWKAPYFQYSCKSLQKTMAYRNIDGEVILYHLGDNQIDEYTFGDDVRKPLPYIQRREEERLYFFIVNSIFLGFLLGSIFTLFLFSQKRRTG